MKHIVLGLSLVAALAAAPALAKEKAMKGDASQKSTQNYRTDTMMQNEDGSLQGKPVVEGPADWSHLAPNSSSSTGASSGESGSNSDSKDSSK